MRHRSFVRRALLKYPPLLANLIYAFCYYYIDENGQKRQKWETYLTEKEAKQRKAEIEYKQGRRTFIAPNKVTVAAFLEDFVSLYGTKKWGPNTYDANLGLIQNYIIITL